MTRAERRAEVRVPVPVNSPVSRARFTGGADVRVRDVSGRGLLAVGERRVPPGRVVAVAWPDVAWLPRQRAMVARCFVARLRGEAGIEYGDWLRHWKLLPRTPRAKTSTSTP